ncbi:putative PRELI domain-containing protein 2 [Hypsibius exemplaris]|uniref:PRELI domain-containing protein 2 n=1 Tax=Hypsibius exemplaris TaxID=2072580 RepID=A0A1W0WWM7_HYPEX|nr:putative PRELI domain-containing protein 2 [Hypsibius exemplaris]
MTKAPEDRKSAAVLGLTEKWRSDKLKEILASFLQFGVSRLTKPARVKDNMKKNAGVTVNKICRAAYTNGTCMEYEVPTGYARHRHVRVIRLGHIPPPQQMRRHIYKYPLEQVADVHLHKYPAVSERGITAIDTLTHSQSFDSAGGIVTYWLRIAHCRNILPRLIRKLNVVLDPPDILVQEECWLHRQPRMFLLRTVNITWADYVVCMEESHYRPADENPEWTECVQTGRLAISGLGPLGGVIEKLSKTFFDKGILKSIELTERNLKVQSLKCPPHQPNFRPDHAAAPPVLLAPT